MRLAQCTNPYLNIAALIPTAAGNCVLALVHEDADWQAPAGLEPSLFRDGQQLRADLLSDWSI